MAKDEWNKFVKNNAHQPAEWWLDHYNAQLEKTGGLTAREWDHYDNVKRRSGASQQTTKGE